jgi:hypothetical protein
MSRPLCFFLSLILLIDKVKVKLTLRLTVCQSVSLGVEPHLGLMTRYLLLFDSYGLTRGWVCICICCWSSPAQSFSGPSPLDLATIFYCLSFETSLFVASYDSQVHGGGIRPRLHTGHELVFFILTSVASIVFKITPQRGPHRKQSLYCCVNVALMCVYRSVN